MATIFSASNFTIISSTADFSGAPVSSALIYECPADKYVDFYIRNIRAIGNQIAFTIYGSFPDGIGGYVNSDNNIASNSALAVSTNSPAGLHTLTDPAVANAGSSYTAVNPDEYPVTSLGKITLPTTSYFYTFGNRHSPVRLLAGDRIVTTASFSAGGTMRVVYKAIEYSST
jgi:hypothetical protein